MGSEGGRPAEVVTSEALSIAADVFAPLTSTMLPVGDSHELYVESVGNSGGVPAVYLHGGPGSGCQPDQRRLFDPSRVHAVLFDQRGAGRSMPKGSREANTTNHLVADMELIREHFGFDRWMIVGGSWGATLALAYAQRHPERVSGIVLRATFLGTMAELEWAFIEGLKRFHPQLHADLLSLLPPEERLRPLEACWRRILDPDPAVHRPMALAWHDTERILSQVSPPAQRLDPASINDPARALPSSPFMEAHYFANRCFLEDGVLLANAGKLADIPGIIIQGRYDLLCPPITAERLASAWGKAQLRVVEAAGHSLGDPGITKAVRQAIIDLAM